MTRLVALQLPPAATVEQLDRLRDRGDAAAPLPPDLSPAARRRLLDRLRADALIDADSERPLPDPEGVDDDVELVVTTSGATGPPKLVELTAEALDASARASLERLAAEPSWRWRCPLPLHHVAGLQVLRRARLLGGRAELVDPGDPAAVADDDVACSLVPTQLQRLLGAGAELWRCAVILLGGGPTDPELRARAQRAGAPVVTTYGMTETCGGCVYDGLPLAGHDARTDRAGRIWLRGPSLLRRYRGDRAATEAVLRSGWLATPDRGRIVDGRLAVLGRLDEVIVTGGENVAAAAVRAVLEADPAVQEAAVVGVSDREWGEAVVAAVVPVDGAVSVHADALRSAVAEQLGRAAAPKRIAVFDALPRTGLGKVDAARLRARLADTDEGG